MPCRATIGTVFPAFRGWAHFGRGGRLIDQTADMRNLLAQWRMDRGLNLEAETDSAMTALARISDSADC